MNIVIFLITTLWTIRIGSNLVSYISLWRIKEYRFDRMLIHLRSPQGWRIFFPPLRRPLLTPKSMTLLVVTGGILGYLIAFANFPLLARLFVADLISFPLTWAMVGLLQLPTRIYHNIIIARAVTKLRAHKKLLVVGITGSYGKTSVKDYLATILAEKFKIIKTEASKNSPIGIAEIVLSKLTADCEIFIVEMGAYKEGEIRKMSSMVRPQIGIVTAINPQHQDLFGSLENTMRAKYELIEGLTGKKLGIFNTDDSRVREMGQWARRDGKDVWWWSMTIPNANTFFAKEIKATLKGVEFQCVYGKEKTKITVPVLGEYQVGNILAAIAGAVACGMNLADAARGATKIRAAKSVMQKIVGTAGATFIDDTFNNNPDAAKAAIAFLAQAQGRKILVFQPMIELGEYASISHKEVGRLAGSVCDEIILTNDSYLQEFRSSMGSTKAQVMNAHKAAEYLQKRLQKNDTVLFKGKEAGRVLHHINMLTR